MRGALAAEWSKLRSLPGTGWLLLGLVVLTGGLSTVVVAAVHATPGAGQDPAKLSLAGVDLGQAVAAVFGVLVVSGEYGTGLIRITLTATPRRLFVLTAKAVSAAALVLVAGLLGIAVSLVAGLVVMPGHGFVAAHGVAVLSLSSGATLRAALGSVLYLTLVALFGVGIAAAVRDTAASLGVVLGLLYVFPIVGQVVTDQTWHRLLQQVPPMTAGLAIQATTNLRALPLSPWAGLGVLAAWSVGALLVGGVVLTLRDA